jgi:hypothetical protein
MRATKFQHLLVRVQSSCSDGLLIPFLWHYLSANFKSSDAEISMLFHSIHSTNISKSFCSFPFSAFYHTLCLLIHQQNAHTIKYMYMYCHFFLLHVVVLIGPPSGTSLCTLNHILWLHRFYTFTLNNHICFNVEL